MSTGRDGQSVGGHISTPIVHEFHADTVTALSAPCIGAALLQSAARWMRVVMFIGLIFRYDLQRTVLAAPHYHRPVILQTSGVLWRTFHGMVVMLCTST